MRELKESHAISFSLCGCCRSIWIFVLFILSELNDLVQLQQKQVAAWTEDRQKVRFHSSSIHVVSGVYIYIILYRRCKDYG